MDIQEGIIAVLNTNIAAVLNTGATLAAAVAAWSSFRLAKLAERRELYEPRKAVYRSAWELIDAIATAPWGTQLADITKDRYIAFSEAMRDARFLFKRHKTIERYLTELDQKTAAVIKLSNRRGSEVAAGAEEEQLRSWFDEQRVRVEDEFMSVLAVEHD